MAKMLSGGIKGVKNCSTSSATPSSDWYPIKMEAKTVSNTKSILRGFWGGSGDGFGEDFGGLGRSWGGKREAKRQKRGDRKRKQKNDAF